MCNVCRYKRRRRISSASVEHGARTRHLSEKLKITWGENVKKNQNNRMVVVRCRYLVSLPFEFSSVPSTSFSGTLCRLKTQNDTWNNNNNEIIIHNMKLFSTMQKRLWVLDLVGEGQNSLLHAILNWIIKFSKLIACVLNLQRVHNIAWSVFPVTLKWIVVDNTHAVIKREFYFQHLFISRQTKLKMNWYYIFYFHS